jgi:hypothetical protein
MIHLYHRESFGTVDPYASSTRHDMSIVQHVQMDEKIVETNTFGVFSCADHLLFWFGLNFLDFFNKKQI